MQRSRSWHMWGGLVIGAPLLLIAVTGIPLAHPDLLRLGERHVNVGWLPAYGTGAVDAAKRQEVKAAITLADGRTIVGTKAGVFIVTGDALVQVPELERMDVRSLEAGTGAVAALVAGSAGVWVLDADGMWTRIYERDVHSASLTPDGSFLVASKKAALLSSRDGVDWKPVLRVNDALAALPVEPGPRTITVAQLMKDMHTGKAFLGKDLQYLWIDVNSIALGALMLTGMWLGYRRLRRPPPRRWQPRTTGTGERVTPTGTSTRMSAGIDNGAQPEPGRVPASAGGQR